ncbi:hypothetical protein [Nocardia farcinica]|uniref:hypothetical protein n=1 Tax=Nocardia farcinica TaxID=37329 RepID=UPI001E2B98DD|nr:hypothetical protein [Nocardia farcinica]
MSDGHQSAATHLALVGLRGRLRLLAGLVRDNRPWRLVPHLAGATAAAAGTAAYGVITSSFWKLADALSPLRLAGITVVSVVIMAVWLMVYNHLWDRPSRSVERRKAVLYNVSTAATPGDRGGVHARDPVRGRAARGGRCDRQRLFRAGPRAPAGVGSYSNLVWLCSSVGIVAGALGSSLEDEETVRKATYSRRERERQEHNSRGREDRTSSERERPTQTA